ncbi:hypothetical protein [Sphingobacterium siyangense]|uniref:hypothetical protein n=1 Tax=Sphingobacterium siyangense TaxID=459529 RepID=UPI00301B310B
MYLTAYLSEVPRPLFWKEKLSKYGHDILFRYYSGEERQPEQVPYPDYQSYYIQLADRISSTPLKIDTLCMLFLPSDELLRPEECFRIKWRRPH